MSFLAQFATKYRVNSGHRAYEPAAYSVMLLGSDVVSIQRPKLTSIKLGYRGLCDRQNLLNTPVLDHDEFASEFKVFSHASCVTCSLSDDLNS